MGLEKLPPELLERILKFFHDLPSHVAFYHLCSSTRSIYTDRIFQTLLSQHAFSRPVLLAEKSFTGIACECRLVGHS